METLESRRLLAGVTLLTHGWNGSITDWIPVAANAIAGRLGGPSQVSEYVLTIAPNSGGQLVAQSIKHVDGTGTPQTTQTGEIILIVDWTSISTNPNYQLSYTASVIANFMMNATVDGIRLAELPLHSISQSRGTDLIDEITKSLGQSGVWVDQETYLDPRPVFSMGDPQSTVYDNLEFMDNYWRDDSNPNDNNSEGYPVNGAYNLNAPLPLQLAHDGSPSAHEAPAAYYIGTIDYTAQDSGQVPIHDSWYSDTPEEPARDQTGFLYTSIVGGTRPLSGVWAASGGTGARTPTGQSGSQWANVSDVTVAGGNVFASGQTIQLNYIQQDRDSNSTVTFYLDPDQNPYDNNFAHVLGSSNLTASSTITSGQTTGATSGVAPGTYWIAAKVSDSQGHVRYSYSRPVTVTGTGAASTVYLSSLTPTSATNGYGPYEKDTSNGEKAAGDGHTITLNGVTYAKGLGTNAPSDISFNLNKQYTTFTSDVGVDDEKGTAGSVVFQVYLDGTKMFDSGLMTNSSVTKSVNLNVSGVTTLRLVVTDGGNGTNSDHGDWAGAQVTAQGTATAPLPAAPTMQNPTAISGQVSLSWTDSLNDQNGFAIQRKTGVNGAYAPLVTLDAGATGYVDTAVAANTTYYYHIYAFNIAGNSDFSNEVSADVPAPPQFIYLSTLTPTSASNGYGPYEKDKSNGEQNAGDGHTITLNGVTYARGLGTNAPSDISFSLNSQYTQFISDIGVDDEKGTAGSVDFQVYLDGTKAFDSGLMTNSSVTQTINLNVSGVTTLRLVVTDGGDGPNSDHGDWAGARLILGQPTPPPAVPAAPTNLTAAYNSGTGQVDLGWTDTAGDQTGFRIERKLGAGGTYAPVTTLSGTTFTFSDPGPFASAGTYIYRVIATNAGGDSQPSNEQTIVSPVLSSVTTYLSDLTPTSATNGYGPYEKDTSNGEKAAGDGHTITLNGVTYAKGLGTNAPSDISFNLNQQYTTFTSDVGVDDEKGTAGSVVFQVYLDGTKMFDSGLMTNSSTTQTVNLNVTGVTTLRLVVTDGGNGNNSDHADWAGARLIAGQPTPPPAVPAAPTNLTAAYNSGTGQVDLGWTDTAGDQTGFRVERKLGAGGTYAPVTTLSGTTFTFSDPGPFASAGTYIYRVIATNAGGDSQPSNEQTIVSPVLSSVTTYLSDLTPTSASNGYGPYEKDTSNGESAAGDGHTITLNGVTYAKGLGVHAPSDISFNLNQQYTTFTSDVGVDDEKGTAGSVSFQVYLDGTKAFDSGVMTNSSTTQTISLNVSGVTTLRLVVTDGGNGNNSDHADWAGARLLS